MTIPIKECEHIADLRVYRDGPGYLSCPNMKPKKDDTDMTGENYACEMCGQHVWIDYDEIR